jgi:hypothetical protein
MQMSYANDPMGYKNASCMLKGSGRAQQQQQQQHQSLRIHQSINKSINRICT